MRHFSVSTKNKNLFLPAVSVTVWSITFMGLNVGKKVGVVVGPWEGTMLGLKEGKTEGSWLGLTVGHTDGMEVLGDWVGPNEGNVVGPQVGAVGAFVGETLGSVNVGFMEGETLGNTA